MPGLNPKDIVGAKKAPLALVPSALVIWAAPAAQNGADKYGPFNWRKAPVQVMTYVEAMQRHLAAFVDGQDLAEDTGIHHLSHVAAGLGILVDSISLGIAVDNRPPRGPAADILREQDKSAAPDSDWALVTSPTELSKDQVAFIQEWLKRPHPLTVGRPLPVVRDPVPDRFCVTRPDGECVATGPCMHTPGFPEMTVGRPLAESWGTGDGPVIDCNHTCKDYPLGHQQG
jgi:hypothetical protein